MSINFRTWSSLSRASFSSDCDSSRFFKADGISGVLRDELGDAVDIAIAPSAALLPHIAHHGARLQLTEGDDLADPVVRPLIRT